MDIPYQREVQNEINIFDQVSGERMRGLPVGQRRFPNKGKCYSEDPRDDPGPGSRAGRLAEADRMENRKSVCMERGFRNYIPDAVGICRLSITIISVIRLRVKGNKDEGRRNF